MARDRRQGHGQEGHVLGDGVVGRAARGGLRVALLRGNLGAIRVFTTGTVHSREELVGFEPGRLFSYSALSGLPIRDHRADVTLAERDGGTMIGWHEDFRAKVPGTGWLYGRFLRWFVQRCADGLARHAASLADRPATAGR
jgi:hypothetical protein